LRFQTVRRCYEFIFRDLNGATSRRVENKLAGNKTFSLYDIKADYINHNYLATIITNLDLDSKVIKMHPNYQNYSIWAKLTEKCTDYCINLINKLLFYI
jgi:hypothetical protein